MTDKNSPQPPENNQPISDETVVEGNHTVADPGDQTKSEPQSSEDMGDVSQMETLAGPSSDPGSGSTASGSGETQLEALREEMGVTEEKDLTGLMMGSCRLEHKLGEGAMGVVYKALNVGLNKPMAVKILPPGMAKDRKRVEFFVREARSAAQLDHPNIVRVYDVNKAEGHYYIIMEYIEGQDLMEMFHDQGKMPYKDGLRVAIEVTKGLAVAEANNVIHRDIKPDNIMVSKSGDIKISDFGLARQVTSNFTAGQEGILGTPYYMAPECIDGRGADIRSDLYAWGASLYYLLTGKRPITGRTMEEILINQMSVTPDPPRKHNSSLPPALGKILLKLLEKHPDNRYQKAEDLLKDLARLAKGEQSIEVDVPSTRGVDPEKEKVQRRRAEKIQEKKKKSYLLSGGMAAVALLVLIGVYTLVAPSLSLRENSMEVQSLGWEDLFEQAFAQVKKSPDNLGNVQKQLGFLKRMYSSESPQVEKVKSWWLEWRRDQLKLELANVRSHSEKGEWKDAVEKLLALHQSEVYAFGRATIQARYEAILRKIRTRQGQVFVPSQEWTFQGKKKVVSAFLIDRYEVTNRDFYEKYVRPKKIAGLSLPNWEGGRPKSEYMDHPVRGVTYDQAADYAETVGKRLPTGAEWMMAARGREKRIYPWGNYFRPNLANNRSLGKGGPLAVHSLKDQSPCGAVGMAGNVFEWTATRKKNSSHRLVLGGSWKSSNFAVGAPYSGMYLGASERNPQVGFRCVQSLGTRD